MLGIGRDADEKQLKSAYRKLARKYHPDHNPDKPEAEKKFKEVNEAYAVLANPEARTAYDRFGHAGGPTGQPGFDFSNFDFRNPGGTFSGFGKTYSGVGFDDIFEELLGGFGRGGRGRRGSPFGRQAPRRGGDVESEMDLEFLEAIKGAKKTVTLEKPDGVRETITFAFPPGVRDKEKIRLRGKGLPGAGGPPGDLIIRVHVKPHSLFRREGNNILLSIGITIAEAVLGGKIPVPTPFGTTTISIPPGTQGGQVFRIGGKGVKRKKGKAGDLLATMKIVVPKNVGDESEELIRKFDSKNPVKPRLEKRQDST